RRDLDVALLVAAGEQLAELLLLFFGAHACNRRRGEAGAADREHDAGTAVRELFAADHADACLALRLLRIALFVEAGQLLATIDDRGLREAEPLGLFHQVPWHRLFLIVLDRDRPHHLLGERAQHLTDALQE